MDGDDSGGGGSGDIHTERQYNSAARTTSKRGSDKLNMQPVAHVCTRRA